MPRNSPQVTVVGNRGRAGGGIDRAGVNGREALVPSAGVALIKSHGLGAGAVGSQGALKQFEATHGDGSDFAAQRGEEGDGAVPGLDENVFFPGRTFAPLRHTIYLSRTSAVAAASLSQILPSQASCSGFISTERRQVTVGDLAPLSSLPANSRCGPGSNHVRGNSTRARCKSRAAQAAKMLCANSVARRGVSALSFQTTMSSSG